MPSSQVKGNADVITILEAKLDYTFPVYQFVLEGCSKPFRIYRNKNEGETLFFVREGIPARLISIVKAPIESFLTTSFAQKELGGKFFLQSPQK